MIDRIEFIEIFNKPIGLTIPGGVVTIEETVETDVVREMEVHVTIHLHGVYSDPARD